jgi:hypothetical protein
MSRAEFAKARLGSARLQAFHQFRHRLPKDRAGKKEKKKKIDFIIYLKINFNILIFFYFLLLFKLKNYYKIIFFYFFIQNILTFFFNFFFWGENKVYAFF